MCCVLALCCVFAVFSVSSCVSSCVLCVCRVLYESLCAVRVTECCVGRCVLCELLSAVRVGVLCELLCATGVAVLFYLLCSPRCVQSAVAAATLIGVVLHAGAIRSAVPLIGAVHGV